MNISIPAVKLASTLVDISIPEGETDVKGGGDFIPRQFGASIASL